MLMHRHFFIVGTQRSATTFLYTQLSKHPQIEMAVPLSPEPKFFLIDGIYNKGLAYYESVFFADKPGALLRGEKSTSYIESEKAARRISESFPEAKLIFVLREPVARAISNYKFSVENGFEKLSLEEALLQEDKRVNNYDSERVSVSPYAYLRRGLYINYIEMYDRYFHPNQLYFILHEHITRSVEVYTALLTFLGADPDFLLDDLSTKVNASTRDEQVLSLSMKVYLEEYFAQVNERLAERTGLDLSVWYG